MFLLYVLILPVYNGVRESFQTFRHVSALVHETSRRCGQGFALRESFLNLFLFFSFFGSDTVCRYLCANTQFNSSTKEILMGVDENT